MLNKVLLIGNLTRDPTIRYLKSGTAVTEFTIAWNRRYKVDEEWREESHFFDVKAYGRLAEDLAVRLSKGYTVVVEGRLSQDRWVGQDGKTYSKVRIIAESVRIIRKPRIEEFIEEEVSPESKHEEETEEKKEIEERKDEVFGEEDEIPF